MELIHRAMNVHKNLKMYQLCDINDQGRTVLLMTHFRAIELMNVKLMDEIAMLVDERILT